MLTLVFALCACGPTTSTEDGPRRAGAPESEGRWGNEHLVAQAGTDSPIPLDTMSVCPSRETGPELLPNVQPEHRTADYWTTQLARQYDLDDELLSVDEVRDHNNSLLNRQDENQVGLFDLSVEPDREALQQTVTERLEWLVSRFESEAYVEVDGTPLSADAMRDFALVELPAALSSTLVVAAEIVPIRCGPRAEAYYTPSLDLRFDRNNCSTAHVGELVEVLERWPNGMMLARTRYTIGWIAADAALSPPVPAEMRSAFLESSFLRLTEPYELISADGDVRATLPAGTHLAAADSNGTRAYFATTTGVYESTDLGAGAPIRTTRRSLTRRALLEEAFGYLGQSYGWGGQSGGRDCSRFLLDLFDSFGLDLPRHSAYQANAGTFSIDVDGLESETERMLLIEAAAEKGIVLLHFPGHIMLYLGRNDEGVPMAIHAFAEYLVPCAEGTTTEGGVPDTLYTVDSIQVSDLELGRGTSRTAFIQRLTRIVVFGDAPGVQLHGIASLRPAAPITEDVPTGRDCGDSQAVAVYTFPNRANLHEPLRVSVVTSEDLGPVELTLISPSGTRIVPPVEHYGGPPYGVLTASLEPTESGRWRAVYGDGERIEACWRFYVYRGPEPTPMIPRYHERMAEREPIAEDELPEPMAPPADESGERLPASDGVWRYDDEGSVLGRYIGPIWEPRRSWGAAPENLFAVWLASLFSYPTDEDITWPSLHEVLLDPDRNFLRNHLGHMEDDLLDEDEDLILYLEPDCADLPYLLRAYFSWKMGLPFGFRRCGRGYAGVPPRCGPVHSNLMPRAFENDVEAFAYYVRRIRAGVHSASGRTHPENTFTDYYPVELTREALRPGIVFADPYGHVLIVVNWVAQGVDNYGMLIAADAQPDATVGRRRFWRGSFLFLPETDDVGAGFKAFRPVFWARGDTDDGSLIAVSNENLVESENFAHFSLSQYEGTVDDFYEQMESLINPRPLDPVAMQVSLIDAFEESVHRRVVSVNNGEEYLATHGQPTIEMPEGHAIFETTGAWEDYSTPSRDMRLLISLDTVVQFPDVVRRNPERFGMSSDGSLDEQLAPLLTTLETELRSRLFTYTRSDGSLWELSLYDVAERAEVFEMSYNPNDCVEHRWAARVGDEYTTCHRQAPAFQTDRMLEYRDWFITRSRPPR